MTICGESCFRKPLWLTFLSLISMVDFFVFTIFRRPLWLTYHNPLEERSKEGKLLPAERSQVSRKEKNPNLFYKKSFFLQTITLPETLNQLPVTFNREIFLRV